MFYCAASRQKHLELNLFSEAVAESNLSLGDIFDGVHLDNWDVALRLLGQALLNDIPSIVIFDEFPYLCEKDPYVEAIFQKQWDRTLSTKPVLMILVGSDLAMMKSLNSHDHGLFQH